MVTYFTPLNHCLAVRRKFCYSLAAEENFANSLTKSLLIALLSEENFDKNLVIAKNEAMI